MFRRVDKLLNVGGKVEISPLPYYGFVLGYRVMGWTYASRSLCLTVTTGIISFIFFVW